MTQDGQFELTDFLSKKIQVSLEWYVAGEYEK